MFYSSHFRAPVMKSTGGGVLSISRTTHTSEQWQCLSVHEIYTICTFRCSLEFACSEERSHMYIAACCVRWARWDAYTLYVSYSST